MLKYPFDIEYFLEFKHPAFMCLKCKALIHELQVQAAGEGYQCPICKVVYLSGEFYEIGYREFFKENSYEIVFDNIVEHCKSLASIAVSAKEYLLELKGEENVMLRYPPMRALLEAIQEAKMFVHFVSFGLSSLILGALKATAIKVPIRGIVSGLSESQKLEIENFSYESPGLQIKTFPKGDWVAPHQKMVIIDGLLAFTGSLNLTNNGLRNAEQGRDLVEYVTDISKIISLNNTLFSPIWSTFYDVDQIVMHPYACTDFDPVY